MSIEGSGASRGGGVGFHNEDAFLVEEGLGLYLVCDGASGTPAGELAAKAAAEAVEDFIERAEEDLDLDSDRVARAVVERAMTYALRAVAEAAEDAPDRRGLETTLTLLLAHGRTGVIGHRGDSRAYLIRRGRAHQLTVDHELTEEAAGAESPEVDVFSIELAPQDTVVLCTDGAENFVQDPAIVKAARELSPRLLASRIVSSAHRRDPATDATAVVVRVQARSEPGWLQLSIPSHETAYGRRLALA